MKIPVTTLSDMFDIFAKKNLLIRSYDFQTGLIGRNITFLFISDLHFSRYSHHLKSQLQSVMEKIMPDFVIIGGDLLDLPGGMKLLIKTFQMLRSYCPVFIISGNHDDYYGLNKIKINLANTNALWLSDCNDTQIRRLIQCEGLQLVTHERNSGIEKIDRPESFRILCIHKPSIINKIKSSLMDFDLILAGHLHGGQIVLRKHRGMHYPCSWIYPYCGDSFLIHQSTMIVSHGVNDTIPFRLNCPRDVIACNIKKLQ